MKERLIENKLIQKKNSKKWTREIIFQRECSVLYLKKYNQTSGINEQSWFNQSICKTTQFIPLFS